MLGPYETQYGCSIFFLLCPDAEIDSSGAVEDLGVKLVHLWNSKLDFFSRFVRPKFSQFLRTHNMVGADF